MEEVIKVSYQCSSKPDGVAHIVAAFDILFSKVMDELNKKDLYGEKELYGDKILQNS